MKKVNLILKGIQALRKEQSSTAIYKEAVKCSQKTLSEMDRKDLEDFAFYLSLELVKNVNETIRIEDAIRFVNRIED